MDNPQIKGVIGGLRDNYGLDTEKLLDSILKERYWVLKVQDDQGRRSMAGLYAGGGLMKLRKQGLYWGKNSQEYLHSCK